MGYYLLLTETILDFIALFLGLLLIVRAHDNWMRLAWGILGAMVALVFLVDNVRWLTVYYKISTELPARNDLLLMPRMLKWFVLAYITSLFPLSSLRPGYLTSMRLVILSIPVGITVIVAICYRLFNGVITPLESLQDVGRYADLLDIQLRLGIFAVTIIIPPFYFFTPLVGKWSSVRRKASPFMSLYIFSILLVLCYYVAFTLFSNDFIFFTYGLLIILFYISFSLFFLLYENPLSTRERMVPVIVSSQESLAVILYSQLEAYLKESRSFTQPDYSIDDLVSALNTRQSMVVEAIKCGGFSGFRELVNYMRIEYFKQLACERRGRSVKELMYDCGFVSRSTFYRIFSSYENMTPTEYIEQLYWTKNENFPK